MGLFSRRKHKKQLEESVFMEAELVAEENELLEAEIVNDIAVEEQATANIVEASVENNPAEEKIPETSEPAMLVEDKPEIEVDSLPKTTAELESIPVLEQNQNSKTSDETENIEKIEKVEEKVVDLENQAKATAEVKSAPKKKAAPKTNATQVTAKKPATAETQKPKSAKTDAVQKTDSADEEPHPYSGKFIIRKTENGNFVFRLLAPNHETIATGEPYTSLTACKTGIASIQKIVGTAGIEDQTLQKSITCANPKWEIYYDDANLFRFRLRARNGEIVAISSDYKSKASCKNGIKSICNNAPTAEVIRDDSI
ncbi:MAG: DUF1508 domain-containing protein [Clostridia bacterium]|nr:DUF1508 domain-containing protein [Clostridia bacterium]